MRGVAQVIGVTLLMGTVAEAAVTLSPFKAPEELAIFAPEVLHALAAGLERSGYEVSDAASGHPVQVSGKIEALAGERVRITAEVGGKRVPLEGEIEHIDDLVAQLAGRIAALLPPSARAASAAAAPKAAGAGRGASPAASVAQAPRGTPAATATVRGATGAPAAGGASATAETAQATGGAAASTHPGGEGKGLGRDPERAPNPEDPGRAAAHPEGRHAGTAESGIPGPVAEAPHPSSGDVQAPSRPEQVVTPQRRLWRRPGSLGVVLLHRINLQGGCRGDFLANTSARTFLESRLHIDVLPSGECGYQPESRVAVEVARTGVPSVLMMWFDKLELSPSGIGYQASGMLRILVMRDGSAIYHRPLALGPVPMTSPDLGRASSEMVVQALVFVGRELQAVLSDAR